MIDKNFMPKSGIIKSGLAQSRVPFNATEKKFCIRCTGVLDNFIARKLCKSCWEVEKRIERYLQSQESRDHMVSLIAKIEITQAQKEIAESME